MHPAGFGMVFFYFHLSAKKEQKMNNHFTLLAVKTPGGDVLPDLVFWPITALFAALFALMFLIFLRKRSSKTMQIIIYVAMILCAVVAIACLALLGKYYLDNIKGDDYYSPFLKKAPLYISAVVLVGTIVAMTLILGSKQSFAFDSRTIAFGAICIAMSFALSYVRLFKLPQGGSVTLVSLLPLLIFSYIFGIKKGVLIGAIYGVLQAIQDPFIIHPAQFLLDYPIAFSTVGLGGIFSEIKAFKKCPQIPLLLGGLLVGVFRFMAHFLSGVFAFGAYANEAGQSNVGIYSLGYNSFVFVDIAITIAVGMVLFSSKAFVKEIVNKQKARLATVTSANASTDSNSKVGIDPTDNEKSDSTDTPRNDD